MEKHNAKVDNPVWAVVQPGAAQLNEWTVCSPGEKKTISSQ
jgi:hypothetical protein